MMVDVKDYERRKGRMTLIGVIANEKLLGPELKDARAGVGVTP